jgi:Rod binding domain-containing protein
MSISIAPTSVTTESVKTGNAAQTLKAESGKSHKSEKADQAIEKFEGMFMSMILKELRKTGTGDGFFPGDKSDTYGGMFDMFVGDHLAKTSDVGLEQLFRSSAALKQLEEHVTGAQSTNASTRSKGLEEYRNEQFRASTALPTGA